MTNKQIEYIVTNPNLLNDNIGRITALEGARYFTLLKCDNKICDRSMNRYKFVFSGDSCLLYCYKCKEYNGDLTGLTEGIHYDVIGGKTYLYLLDSNNNPVIDILNGNEITQFITREGSKLWQSIKWKLF